MRRPPRRPAAIVAAATLFLLALAPAAAPGHLALAADRGLVVIAQATYEALPLEALVHVTIDAVATSYTPDAGPNLVYYPATTFAVHPEATNVEASSDGHRLGTQIVEQTLDYLAVKVTFAKGVFYGESYAYRVTYDLPDPGGAPNREVHVGRSIVAFPVWAFGTPNEPGGSVEVQLPAGFQASVQGEDFVRSTTADGGSLLSATQIPDPSRFSAYLSADRPGAFTETSFIVSIGEHRAPVLLRAWEDDPDWAVRMHVLMKDGLPALSQLIGLPYPVDATLRVEEAAGSLLGDYAGIYSPDTDLMRIRYDADAYVALHEAAHIWFNGSMFADRWIGEAWAEFYGVHAGGVIKANGEIPGLTDALLADRIALNDWGALGTVDPKVEDYAYAATYELAEVIFRRTNLDGLRRTWSAVSAGEMSYQPLQKAGAVVTGAPTDQPGWQRLLDLLDERTGASFDDLWATWVVSEGQAPSLVSRAATRERYRAVAVAATPWQLPQQIRVEMGAWQFADAQAALETASQVIDDRALIAARAGRLGLMAPVALRAVFEATGPGAPEAASVEARNELAALAEIDAARLANLRDPDLFQWIGLMLADPASDLSTAGKAFESADLPGAVAAADRVLATRSGAETAGRLRVAAGGGLLVVSGGATLVATRRRRRARAADAGPVQPGPFA